MTGSSSDGLEDVPADELVGELEGRGFNVIDPSGQQVDIEKLSSLMGEASRRLNGGLAELHDLATNDYPNLAGDEIRSALLDVRTCTGGALDLIGGVGFHRQATFRGEATVSVYDGPMIVEGLDVTEATIQNPNGVTSDIDDADPLRTDTCDFVIRTEFTGHEFRNLPEGVGSKPVSLEDSDRNE